VRIPIEGTLDLHAFAPRDIMSVVEEYVNEAHATGLSEVRFIHGRGIGVQRLYVGGHMQCRAEAPVLPAFIKGQ